MNTLPQWLNVTRKINFGVYGGTCLRAKIPQAVSSLFHPGGSLYNLVVGSDTESSDNYLAKFVEIYGGRPARTRPSKVLPISGTRVSLA